MEMWKDVDGYRGYRVSNCGLVTGPRGFRIGSVGNRGYTVVHVVIYGTRSIKKLAVHRLVATAFLPCPNANRTQVHHINGVKTDNRAENLTWVSAGEHASLHDTPRCSGEANGQSKLTGEAVIEMRKRYASGNVSQAELAMVYGVTKQTARSALRRETWVHL